MFSLFFETLIGNYENYDVHHFILINWVNILTISIFEWNIRWNIFVFSFFWRQWWATTKIMTSTTSSWTWSSGWTSWWYKYLSESYICFLFLETLMGNYENYDVHHLILIKWVNVLKMILIPSILRWHIVFSPFLRIIFTDDSIQWMSISANVYWMY